MHSARRTCPHVGQAAFVAARRGPSLQLCYCGLASDVQLGNSWEMYLRNTTRCMKSAFLEKAWSCRYVCRQDMYLFTCALVDRKESLGAGLWLPNSPWQMRMPRAVMKCRLHPAHLGEQSATNSHLWADMLRGQYRQYLTGLDYVPRFVEVIIS